MRERAREAVASERARIARELHDIVAHSVSIIALQAGAAEALVERDPAAAREHLGAVRRMAHDALGEMRRLLDVLREDDPVYTPTPDVADVDELVAASGLPVSLSRSGDFTDVPAGVSLAVYRIVQESLTNVVRHSTAENAAVTVTYGAEQLTLAVDNDGRPLNAGPSSGGSGITGMRERARALGGDLSVRRHPGGGFSVRATLPIESNGDS